MIRLFKKTNTNATMQYMYGFTIAAALIIGLLANGSAQAAPQSCSNPIKACGCVIDKKAIKKVPGRIFTVANNLSASQTSEPNCIEILEPETVLNVKGFNVEGSGDGTGIGIWIRQQADHVLVAGGDVGAGQFSAVALWNIGIRDDADYSTIELFENFGPPPVGGTVGNNTGVLLNGVNHCALFNFHADINDLSAGVTHFGIKLQNTQNCRFNNFDASTNDIGVLLDSSNSNRFSEASVMSNNQVGYWLQASSNNALFNCNGTENNGDIGILLGCGPEKGCSISGGSNNNRVAACGAKNSGVAGILIDKDNGHNIITVTHNTGNPDNADMVDNNSDCGTDLWYNNEGTGNQKCVTLK